MRLAFALIMACGSATAEEASCPQAAGGAPLMAAAIRVGPASDRVELAGGDARDTAGGYEIAYRFPGHEIKWLACFYGKDGTVEKFQRLSERSTECRLKVVESRRRVAAGMTCK
jgi:hypothetical protein